MTEEVKEPQEQINELFEAISDLEKQISEDNAVTGFYEKPIGDGGYINGGYFLIETDILHIIDDATTSWEDKPMKRLVAEKQISAFKHNGFWHPMDNIRDMAYLNDLWRNGEAPWKIW